MIINLFVLVFNEHRSCKLDKSTLDVQSMGGDKEKTWVDFYRQMR